MLPRTLLALGLLFVSLSAVAQPAPPAVFDLATQRDPITTLSDSWHFHTGDDPAWASPVFDDSSWPLQSAKPWDGQGYKAYSGYAWYRATVILPANAPPQSLYLPDLAINSNAQFFANGKLLPACSSTNIEAPISRPPTECPLSIPSSPQPQTVLLAIRVWHWPHWASYVPGGFRAPIRIGEAAAIHKFTHLAIDSNSWSVASVYIFLFLHIPAAMGAFLLFRHRPKNREYLWFAIYCTTYSLNAFCAAWYGVHIIDIRTRDFLGTTTTVAASLSLLEFYNRLLNGNRGWAYRIVLTSILLFLPLLFLGNTAMIPVPVWNAINTLLQLPFAVWVIAFVLRRSTSGSADARLLVVAAILSPIFNILNTAAQTLFQSGILQSLPVWVYRITSVPFPIALTDVIDFIFLTSVGAILLLRFLRISTQGERTAAELEAARSVQRVLVPDEINTIPGITIQAAYEPANELSGDFYQVLPTPSGATLIALGDVSGKGLRAAMTGTLAIGVMRRLAAENMSPADLLTELNRQLCAAQSGEAVFLTMVCAQVSPDGILILAKAGHLNPYLNGQEIELGPSIPLGISPAAEYSQLQLTLQPGQPLTLLSDGVVEARNPEGQLFGFDRTAAISAQPPANIAAAAKLHGQDDDITIVSLTLNPA